MSCPKKTRPYGVYVCLFFEDNGRIILPFFGKIDILREKKDDVGFLPEAGRAILGGGIFAVVVATLCRLYGSIFDVSDDYGPVSSGDRAPSSTSLLYRCLVVVVDVNPRTVYGPKSLSNPAGTGSSV